MSEFTRPAADPSTTDLEVVHEAYSFACMRCSHVWEQAYDIEHHVDASGRTVVAYLADGERVPSPLSQPTCGNCGGHEVRIMQAGTVSNLLLAAAVQRRRGQDRSEGREQQERGGEAAEPRRAGTGSAAESGPERHWHPHLPHFIHRRPPTDTGSTDTGPTDTGPTDTGPTDTGPTDTGKS